MFLKFARNALGLIIVFFDWLTRPKAAARDAAQQVRAQNAVQGHSLYQLYACPFCVKTRRAIHQLGIKLDARDINKHSQYRNDLENEAGRVKVPCLRIDDGGTTQWMYESNDIIAYLQQRVAHTTAE